MKGWPWVPVAVSELVIAGAEAAEWIAMTRPSGELVPAALLAVMLAVVTPAAEGVPVMTPVTGLMASPAGSPVAA